MARILLVEDDPSLISLYKKKIEHEGYQVDTAMDGQAGLFKAKTRRYQLIVLDLLLPKTDGLEVLKQIKGNQDLSETPVIILTNVGSSDLLIEQAKKLGANDFILKFNTSLDELVRKIKENLKKDEDDDNQ